MNSLIRKVIVLAAGALLVAGAAAGIPSVATSTRPLVLKVCATNDGGGPGPEATDPQGNCIFVIRDPVPNIIPGARVVINLSGCPHVRLCPNPAALPTAPSPGAVNCVFRTVTATTDINGQVRFRVMGEWNPGNIEFPNLGGLPHDYFVCATVTVTDPSGPSFTFPNIKVSTMNIDAAGGGVTGGDLSDMVTDRFAGNFRERSDHDGLQNPGPGPLTGTSEVTGGDLSVGASVRLGGGSDVGCNPAGCP